MLKNTDITTKYGPVPDWVITMFEEISNPKTMPSLLNHWRQNLAPNAEKTSSEAILTYLAHRIDIHQDAIVILAGNPNLPTEDLLELLRASIIGYCSVQVGQAVLNNPVLPLLMLENPNLELNLPSFAADYVMQLHEGDSLIIDRKNKFTPEETAVIKDLVMNFERQITRFHRKLFQTFLGW